MDSRFRESQVCLRLLENGGEKGAFMGAALG